MKTRKPDTDSFLKSDRAILIICIGIALVFWLLVKLSHNFDSLYVCKINYSLPPGKTFVQLPPGEIRATLNGRGWDLLSYYFSNKHAQVFIDLVDMPNQTISVNQLKNRIRSGASSIEVIKLDHDFINVELENEAVRKVPVTLQKQISFAEGFQMKSPPSLSPDSVQISGPNSLVIDIDQWPTQRLELNDLRTNYQAALKLVVPIARNPLQIQPDQINVSIEVEEFTERSVFVPVTVKNAPDSIKIFPEKIRLSCVVGLSQYSSLESSLFVLEADLKGVPINTGNNTIAVELTESPTFVKNISFSPQSVEFFIVEKKDKLN